LRVVTRSGHADFLSVLERHDGGDGPATADRVGEGSRAAALGFRPVPAMSLQLGGGELPAFQADSLAEDDRFLMAVNVDAGKSRHAIDTLSDARP
jgi:hypothetical protein